MAQPCTIRFMEELTLNQARFLLRAWANTSQDRDRRVRVAAASGLSQREISRLTGLARLTIARIIDGTQDMEVTGSD
jgi:hypothetical protein